MSHARSTHCIFHHMGRENQEGNEPCFSDTFNTFWETQTTWLARASCLNWHRIVVAGGSSMMMTGQLPQQSTTLGSRHAPHGTTIFTMPNSHLLKSWHLCPLWYRSSERSYWTLTDKIGLNFVIFSDSNRLLTTIHSIQYGHFYLWIVKKTSNIRSR